jgi:hypothetical protein
MISLDILTLLAKFPCRQEYIGEWELEKKKGREALKQMHYQAELREVKLTEEHAERLKTVYGYIISREFVSGGVKVPFFCQDFLMGENNSFGMQRTQSTARNVQVTPGRVSRFAQVAEGGA